jgi:predicted PurR-regulated permease PerM
MVMVDVICLELALAFVIVATLAAVATTSASPTVRVIANKVVNGSAAAILISAVLAVWFLYWPPASTVGSPPQQHAQTLADQRDHTGDALVTR